MDISTKYLKFAFGYLMIGIALGLYMAMTLNYVYRVTHAHLLMLGFIVSIAYAVTFKCWLTEVTQSFANKHFIIHQLGTALLIIGFICIYDGYVHPAIAGITAGIGALLNFTAALMVFIKIKS